MLALMKPPPHVMVRKSRSPPFCTGPEPFLAIALAVASAAGNGGSAGADNDGAAVAPACEFAEGPESAPSPPPPEE